MCSGSEADSYLRLIDFVYHSTLGLSVIKKKTRSAPIGLADYFQVDIPGVRNKIQLSRHQSTLDT